MKTVSDKCFNENCFRQML